MPRGIPRQPQYERFWARVNKHGVTPTHVTGLGECWEWTGDSTESGYGVYTLGGVRQRTHRITWMWENGPIPEGMFVLHKCDNPSCVRVSHLFLGDHKSNMADARSKGRMNRGSSHGMAKLTEDVVLTIREMYRNQRPTYRELAEAFGVTDRMIGLIVRGRNWRHVDG